MLRLFSLTCQQHCEALDMLLVWAIIEGIHGHQHDASQTRHVIINADFIYLSGTIISQMNTLLSIQTADYQLMPSEITHISWPVPVSALCLSAPNVTWLPHYRLEDPTLTDSSFVASAWCVESQVTWYSLFNGKSISSRHNSVYFKLNLESYY